MKKRLLPVMLALLLLVLCGCANVKLPSFGGSGQTPAPAVNEPQTTPETSADIQVFQTVTGTEENEPETPLMPETPEDTEAEATPAPEPTPVPTTVPVSLDDENTVVRDLELVRVLNYIPDLKVDLKYATTDNYTGKVVYNFDEPYLRYGTVKKLAAAQAQFKQMGYELVLWDAYRPSEAQFVLFDAFPNGSYVANPYGGGHSSHTSGGTVDVALMKDGELLEMPSKMDEFSSLGDRNYSDVSAEAASNAKLLEQVMTANDFSGYFGEWWHYTDNTGYNYADVEGAILPEHATRVYESVCNEYINIRRVANPTAEAIGNIPNGERMTVLSYLSDFAHIQYGDVTGYVNSHFIKPIYPE